MTGKTIALFAPYGLWSVHHQFDGVVGAALMQRGVQVKAVTCDGIFSHCPLMPDENTTQVCDQCMKSADRLFTSLGVQTVTLGSLVRDQDVAHCQSWVDSLPDRQLPKAVFEGAQLGAWLSAGMHSRFTSGVHQLDKSEVVQAYRGVLADAAVLTRALNRFYDDTRPDHLICYSAMHAWYSVAFGLARMKNIPVLVHERGTIDDSFLLLQNCPLQSCANRIEAFQAWQDVPLAVEELAWIRAYIHDRESGRNLNWHAPYAYASDAATVRRQLRIAPETKIVAVFPSNDWEYGMLRDIVPMTFESQIDGIDALIADLPAERFCVVVRLHPPLGHHCLDYGTRFLEDMLAFARRLPPNVRLIMPGERLTSYALLWNADAVVTFGSTLGLESIFRGVHAVSFIRNRYTTALEWVSSPTDLGLAVEQAVARTGDFGVEDLRKAYRATFFLFNRLNWRFTSFGIRDFHHPHIRIQTLNQLAPGNDPAIDRLCGHILQDKPLYPVPVPGDHQRELSPETAFLQEEIKRLQSDRQAVKRACQNETKGFEPMVTVVRVRQDGRRDPQDTVFGQSLKRSRHRHLETLPYNEVSFPSQASAGQLIEELGASVQKAGGDFIYFATDCIQVDEALFTEAVDCLERPANTDRDGVIIGAWVCDSQGRLQKELFTNDDLSPDVNQSLQALPLLHNPAQMLPLVLMRKDAWQSLIGQLPGNGADRGQLTQSLFALLFGIQATFNMVYLKRPLVTIHLPESDQQLISSGLSKGLEGRWPQALKRFDRLADMQSGDAAFHRGLALLQMGQLWPARLIAEAAVRYHPRDDQCLGLLEEIKSRIGQDPLRYEAVAWAVESVDGWLVPGQERFLFEKVRSLPDGAVVVEIGSCFGRSTTAMAFACWGTSKHIFAIDTFIGNTDGGTRLSGNSFFDVWEHNLKSRGLLSYVTPLTGFSQEHLAHWNGKGRSDFVFVDAAHLYKDIIKEFEMVYPMVKDGGWIAFHDVEPAWPGPWRVWHESAKPLLSDHQYSATLACGRKQAGRPFTAPDPQAPFDYALSWADHLRPHLPPLAAAMDLTLALGKSPVDPVELDKAEKQIASMPDHPMVRGSLREMLKLEASVDPFLNYWNALTLQQEHRPDEAAESLKKALAAAGSDLRRRISALGQHLGTEPSCRRGQTAIASAKPDGQAAPRIVLINTYYPKFIDSHYHSHPNLRTAVYTDQLEALIASRFGDSDFYSQGLRKAGWLAEDLIINCLLLQHAWAAENNFSGQGLEIAIEQIRRLRPQVVYLQDLSLATASFLARLRPLTELIVGQIASPLPPQTDIRGLDIIFSSFPHFVERFRDQGITAYYQPLAFDPRVLEQIAGPSDLGRPYAVTFVGGISPAHGKGLEILERLAQGMDIDFWGYGSEHLPVGSPIAGRHHGEAWGLGMFKLLAQSQITINRHIDVAENSANNMRLFEATGCGALLITDYKDNLSDLFEIGAEVAVYRSAEEALALVNYYRTHPQEAEAIARAGQQRTLRDHTYTLRMGQTADILSRHLRYRSGKDASRRRILHASPPTIRRSPPIR